MSISDLEPLVKAISGTERILILTHNDPDPDAIGSAVALRHLLANSQKVPVEIAYRGIIGRAENKALIRYLGNPLQQLKRTDLLPPVSIALVDTQPGAGNSPLNPTTRAALVIDHHPWHPETASTPFYAVRPDVGATSTILTQYLQMAGIEIPAAISTALFYGIKTDTMGLGRSGFKADAEAYAFLAPRIDSQALFEIEKAQVPAEYFKSLADSLQATRIYRDVLITYIGRMDYPDLAAEIANWLLRLKGIQWVICLGAYKELLNVAIRCRRPDGGAGKLAQTIIGDSGTAGGHGSMAGGQVPLRGSEPEMIAARINDAVLAYFKISPDETSRSLLAEGSDR